MGSGSPGLESGSIKEVFFPGKYVVTVSRVADSAICLWGKWEGSVCVCTCVHVSACDSCVCLWAHLSIHPSLWLCVCVFSVYVCVWICKSRCLCLCGSVVWVYLSVFPSVICLGAAKKRSLAWVLPYDSWTCSLNHCVWQPLEYWHCFLFSSLLWEYNRYSIYIYIYICWINISEGSPPGPALWEAPEVPKRGPRMWEKLQPGIFLS